jgi:molybdopterin synthase catalytic subunit
LPIKIRVLYFARARDITGKTAETLFLDGPTNAAGLLDRIVHSNPELLPMRSSLRVAINQELATDSEGLQDGDEFAILPPVAGG